MNKLAAVFLALLVIACGGFLYLNQSTNGIVGFYAWSTLGGRDSAQEIAVNGTTLHVETFGTTEGIGEGTGEPVLVLHGGTAFLETVHPQIRLLAQTRTVIAPDSRAHGRSHDQEDVPLTYELMAEDMIALMDEMGIAQADVFGWSDGGNIGLLMARSHPDRVRRLVMYGSNAHHSAVDGSLMDRDPESESWETVRSFYQSIAPNPDYWPTALGKTLDMWATGPTLAMDDLGDIKAPVLVMAGEFDSIDEAHTRAMAQALPNGQLVIVEGQDHFAPLMAPQTVNPHVADFLK